MGLLEQLRSPVPRYGSTYAPWDNFWFQGLPGESDLAFTVSPELALRLSAVWACTGLRAEGMASLPLILYVKKTRGRRRATEHPLFNRLRWQPNESQTAFEFEELAEMHLCLRGNFYARIQEVGGQVVGLRPLSPDRVTPALLPSGRMQYVYRRPGAEAPETLSQNQVHHRRGRSLDGVKGLSPIEYAARTLGIASAGDRSAGESFTGGAVPPFALVHPGTLGVPGQANLRESVNKYRAGEKFLVLEEKIEVKQLGVSAHDAQLLESRQFGIEEIARIYNVPLHLLKINKAGTVSYASVEMFDIDFVMHTLRPEANRNEQAIWRDLLSEREQDTHFVEYLLDAMLRGDTAARGAFYKALSDVKAITPNEIREKENFENPLEGGDEVADVPPTPAKPGPADDPRDPRGRPRGEAEIRGRLITREAAARTVQKEIANATKAAAKYANDGAGWATWCREFYADHAGFVSHVLKLSSSEARIYADQQRDALISKGVVVMGEWEARVVPKLAALALGEAQL